MDDVANNKVIQFDRLSRSKRTSVQSNFLFIDFILEAQELLVLTVVTNRGNQSLGKQT
jgi:hypothetical protein